MIEFSAIGKRFQISLLSCLTFSGMEKNFLCLALSVRIRLKMYFNISTFFI